MSSPTYLVLWSLLNSWSLSFCLMETVVSWRRCCRVNELLCRTACGAYLFFCVLFFFWRSGIRSFFFELVKPFFSY
ncbi:hypothetical protein HOY80DRAFT_966759 [Tuber brumale]|nr:hypothetical protein HOY80DRAFT_966759 [Tuber brumale]